MVLQYFSRAAIFALAFASSSYGEKLPLYELGVGIGGLRIPHYLGAEQNHNILAPTPYLIYRGERLRLDRSGLRTFLVDEERFDFSISAGFSLPVDSDDNRARSGMPDLDLLLEVGPTLRYTPWSSPDGDRILRLDLPVRGALSADGLDMDYQGLTSSPTINYFRTSDDWNWTASYSAIFGDSDYHSYFYDVGTDYVTPQRDFHRAEAGYTGSRFSLSATRHYPNWFVGGYVRYYSQHGAANRDSPLMKQNGNVSAGLIVAWLFKKSKTMVESEPEFE